MSHVSRPTSPKIIFRTEHASFDGLFNDTEIAREIRKTLPISSTVKRWGDEIYFDVSVKMANTRPTLDVEIGDVAYWPEGPCLCVFFGKTPASTSRKPRPASPVTIVGHTQAPVSLLRTIAEGSTIVVSHADPSEDSSV